mgnify:CR=1 FL=1
MTANKRQLQEVHTAIAGAFDRAELDQLVRYELDARLDLIAGPGNLSQVIHELIKWADREGRLDELVAAAYSAKPRNPKVAELYKRWNAPSKGDSKVLTMSKNADDRDYIMLKDLAQRLGRHPTTVLNWYKDGKVKVKGYKNYRGWWMFRRQDIQKFVDYQNRVDPVG